MTKTEAEQQLEDEVGETDLEALERTGDIPALLRLAKLYRTGEGVPQDSALSFAAYEAAARLGSGDAHYAIALFHLTGRIEGADSKVGLGHLREAADGEHLQARVYLGNLYASGIHYKRDPEKADVWYRAAARTAAVDAAPGTPAYALALAQLGCGSWIPKAGLAEGDASLAAIVRKAKNLGYREEGGESVPVPEVRLSTSPPSARPAPVSSLSASHAAADAEDEGRDKTSAPRNTKKKPPEPNVDRVKREPRFTPGAGLSAFMYATLFVGAAAGAGYALEQGAAYLVAQKAAVPLFGTRTDIIGPTALFVFGLLPTLIVYKLKTWLRAVPGALLGAGAGWVLWGTGQCQWLPIRIHQTGVFACAGFLAVLLVFGIAGGARRKPSKAEASL